MNAREKRLIHEFPSAMDEIVNKEFGDKIQCRTGFNIVSMSRTTTFAAEGKKAEIVNAFIRGFISGNQELVARLREGAQP